MGLSKLRIIYNYFLWSLKIRKILPKDLIAKVKINENNDELINIKKENDFFFSKELSKEKKVFLRKTVFNKLQEIQKKLPNNTNLKIYSAFRPKKIQIEMWEKELKKNKKLFKNKTKQEIEQITRKEIADPRQGFGGHQTGGAIDISLCDDKGKDFNMGTNWLEFNEKTITSCKILSKEEKENRKLLLNLMAKQGFKNYPKEWWHFSYGDQMWGAYSKRKSCFYGEAKEK